MGIKVFDRQRLHPVEQIVSEMEHGTLTYIDHDPVVGKCCDDADSHNACQLYKILSKTAEVIGAVSQHRCNIIIHQCLWECCSHDSCNSCDQNTGYNQHKRKFIIMKHIFDDPADQPGSRSSPGS